MQFSRSSLWFFIQLVFVMSALAQFNIGNRFNLGSGWWNGPNVCQTEYEKEVEDSDNSYIRRHAVMTRMDCDDTDTTFKCITTVTAFGKTNKYVTIYECCHGYQRVPGRPGCMQRRQLSDLVYTAQRLNLNSLIGAVQSAGLVGLLQRGNFTVFAPNDDAFSAYVPGQTALQQVLAAHVVDGYYKSSRLEDEMILDTANPAADIRINKYDYPRRLVTANCKAVVSSDNVATNGVIHVVSSVLEPVQQDLLQLIRRDPDLSTLESLLDRTGLSSTLRGVTGDFTLFAPTNAAFNKVDRGTLNKLLSENTCLSNVLKHHLVDNVICSSIIQSNTRTRNLLKNCLRFTKSSAGVTVNGAQVVGADIMGTNGVLHKIDKVLVPDEALDIIEIGQQAGATELISLITAAGLTKTLQTAEDITVFAPSNEAIQSLPPATLSALARDPVALGKILKFHVVPSVVTARELCSGKELDTLEGDKKVTAKYFSQFPYGYDRVSTVQCAVVNYRAANIRACNGIIHVIDKVMLPPQGDLVQVLSQDSRFSTLVSLVQTAGLVSALQQSGPFTVFAPVNEAFARLPPAVVRRLTSPSGLDDLRTILQRHVVSDALCCAGVFNSRQPTQVKTLGGSPVSLSRDSGNGVTVNSVSVTSCDIAATNGVIHAISDVIPE